MSVDRTIKPEALPQFPWPMPGPNERVALFTAPVELTVGDKRIPGQCEFAWSLTPHPCLECRVLVEESGKAIVTLRGFAELVVKDGTEVAFPVFVRAVRLVSGRPAEISAVVPQGLCIGDTDHAECLLFQIVNFGDFHCGSDYVCELPGGGWSRLGHIQLQCDNWAFEITQVLNAQKGIREAEASEGFAVTHVGCLSRPDSALFTFPEARAALHMLHHFLGFVCGRWCGPTIGVGQDAQGESISWHWSMYTVDSWRTRRTWFPGMHADVLKQLFPSFARMWGNRTWQDPLRYAVYWYLLANNLPNVEARVVLLQNALELLSWTYAVEDRQLLSSRGFKKLWASDEIRILLFSLDIPMAIPPDLPRLARVASSLKLTDGPHVFTGVRNAIVHPDPKRRDQLIDVSDEAQVLGLWYVELALLRLLGYSGPYHSRMKRMCSSDVEDVPWADTVPEASREHSNGTQEDEAGREPEA